MSASGRSVDAWTLIQAGGPRGGGNRLVRLCENGVDALLKIYYRRRPWASELVKRVTCGPLEGRVGVTAAERCALERESLSLWSQQGFDVPALLERPLPEGLDARTATWMEFVDGELLSSLLARQSTPADVKLAWMERLAQESGRRHGTAVEREDVRLLMEHATVKHVVVRGNRLAHFDLETAFHPRLPLIDALARELSSTLRSLSRNAPAEFDALGTRFLHSHPFPELLRQAAERGLHGRGLFPSLRRFSDQRRRAPGTAKTDMLRWVFEVLQPPARVADRRSKGRSIAKSKGQ